MAGGAPARRVGESDAGLASYPGDTLWNSEGQVHPVLLVSIAAILASPSVLAAPVGPVPVQGTGIGFDGACSPSGSDWLWTCLFTGWVTDPWLILFRWDFNGDGVWDTGSPASGGWTAEAQWFYGYDRDGAWRVCVQGWDGVTTREVGGQIEPVGPTACRMYVLSMELTLSPPSWDRGSAGHVTLMLDVPREFVPSTRRAQSASLWGIPGTPYGVPAKVGFAFRGPGTEPTLAYFYADIAAVTAYIGPGHHEVALHVKWGGAVVEGAGEVTIL